MACKNLEYPADKLRIWLCDDGRREDMRRLCEELGIDYISRPSNEHAKAGNLNNALNHTTGELIVTLDADMIPKPEFLNRTVGFFRDINVAFVQTPQSFFNEDVFQYNLFQSRDIPNEQDLFMRIIRAGIILFYDSMASGAVLINLFWTAYNVMGLIPAVMMGWERPRLRNTERFKHTYIATLKTEGEIYGKRVLFGKTLDVSESGCRVLFRQLVSLPEKLTVIIHGYKRHEIQSRVVYFDSHEDGFQVGLKFELFSPESFKEWVWELYGPKPDESLFKLHPGSSWISIFYKYLLNFHLRYKAKTRSSPRIPMNITCQLQVFPSTYLPAIEEMAATKEPSLDRNI